MSTENQNLPVRRYEKQFRELLQAVFSAQSYFGDFFAGGLEALDGVQNNATAFSVKTSDIPVVVGTYSKDANTAFGTGTSKSNRFGPRTEIVYVDTDAPYTWPWSIHEGIDNFTVNNVPEVAIADRLELHARAKTRLFNAAHAKFIAANAGHTETLADYTEANVTVLFNDLAAYFVNIEATGQKVAKVNTLLYNALVDAGLAKTDKGSTVDIDGNSLPMFKDFAIQVIPDALLSDGTNDFAAFAYITGMGKAFTGINTARTIQSEDFDGVSLQGAGMAGEFILDDNKVAIVKVTAPTP
jgi:hypothetical protein